MKMLKSAAALAMMCGACWASGAVQTNAGLLEGTTGSDGKVHIYKGIPFAAPPVGPLRWKAPQPVTSWTGVRKADAFGSRCMQAPIFHDMVFRDPNPSEDCLYLNVWTPAENAAARLPVMVWIYGGGFQAGAASEPRQDGENLAHKGVVVVSMNYRLGVFGFFAHPQLTKESGHNASGNYGFMDQAAAIQWVHDNIAAFGGDPGSITIFGESAGSMSVSAQMASPLSKNLFQRAIGESGGMFTYTNPPPRLAESEETGQKFATAVGASNLQDLRSKPAQELLDASIKGNGYRFWPNVDGYFLPATVWKIYAYGEQAHVPLLAGWNQDEQTYQGLLGHAEPTRENYVAKLESAIGKEKAAEVLKLYPASTDEEVKQAAGQLAGDRFIAYSTWKWLEYQVSTGHVPVYRYHFEEAPPAEPGKPGRGAYHSADIPYVFETLDADSRPWTGSDRKLSDLMSDYWTNFAKTGDPNGPGLPKWPVYDDADQFSVMHLNADSQAAADSTRTRYLGLDSMVMKGIAARKAAEQR